MYCRISVLDPEIVKVKAQILMWSQYHLTALTVSVKFVIN
jgi:hypothetical protein